MTVFQGTDGDDQLRGPVPSGLPGPLPPRLNDRYIGLAGNDSLSAGTGSYGDFSFDSGAGDDVVLGTGGLMRILSNVGAATFLTSTTNADLGNGNDFLSLSGTSGNSNGGAGFDVLSFNGALFNRSIAAGVSVTQNGIGIDPQISVTVNLATGIATSTGYQKVELVRNSTVPLVLATFTNVLPFTQNISGFEAVSLFTGNDIAIGSNAPVEVFATGGGRDSVDGAGGIDLITISRVLSDVTIDLAAGIAFYLSDTERFDTTFANVEGAIGGFGHDTLLGGAGNDFFFGGAGRDTMTGNGGSDTILLDVRAIANINAPGLLPQNSPLLDTVIDLEDSTFDDREGSVDTFSGIENVWGGPGNETMSGTVGVNELRGNAGDDTLIGRGGNDNLFGGAGDDSLDGGDGVDAVDGGDGDDTLDGGDSRDIVKGGAGEDDLHGGNDDDLIFGDDGPAAKHGFDDALFGDSGEDTLRGYAGNDSLFGGADFDLLLGGMGNDHLDGGKGDDNLDGEADNDTLEGGAGKDQLEGGDGDDVLNGGDGNDILLPGDGVDRLDGGDGTDLLTLDGATSKIMIDLQSFDFDGGGFGRNTIRNVEVVLGSGQKESILGSGAKETFSGMGGNDVLDGRGGNDLLFGGDGSDKVSGGGGRDELYGERNAGRGGDGSNDELDGGSGKDKLYGGGGNDILRGGADVDVLDGGGGKDTLSGGGGRDTFVFSRGTRGVTTITDFNHDNERVDVSGRGFASETLAATAVADLGNGNSAMTINGDVLIFVGIAASQIGATNFLL